MENEFERKRQTELKKKIRIKGIHIVSQVWHKDCAFKLILRNNNLKNLLIKHIPPPL